MENDHTCSLDWPYFYGTAVPSSNLLIRDDRKQLKKWKFQLESINFPTRMIFGVHIGQLSGQFSAFFTLD